MIYDMVEGIHSLDHIVVRKLLQQGDLSDGCAWYSLLFLLQAYLFQGDDFACQPVSSSVYNSICSLSYTLQLFVLQI